MLLNFILMNHSSKPFIKLILSFSATHPKHRNRSISYGVIRIWRRHLSIVDTDNNCEAPFWAGCQPLFVLAGCLLLNYSSLLREWHSPTPALQPFLVFCQLVHEMAGGQGYSNFSLSFV